MDNKRFLIIVGLSLIFILFFCNDILEGSIDMSSTVDETKRTSGEGGTQNSDVDVDVSASESSTSDSRTSQRSISNVSNDISTSTTERTEGTSSEENNNETEIQVFGVDCVSNCSEYFHKCAYEREEAISTSGRRKNKVVAENFNKIENCPNGEIPEQSCDDPDWGCKKCNEGYYRDKNNLCKPSPGVIHIISFIISLLIFGGICLFVYFRFLRFKGRAYALGAKDAGFTRI